MNIEYKSVKAKISGDDLFMYISIGGTDESEDLAVTFNSRKNIMEFHSGCDEIAIGLMNEINKKQGQFKSIKNVRIKGLSMGAGVAELLAYRMSHGGWNVSSVKLYGGYGVAKGDYYHPYLITRVRKGNDIVPLLFSWKYKNKPFRKENGVRKGWPFRFILYVALMQYKPCPSGGLISGGTFS